MACGCKNKGVARRSPTLQPRPTTQQGGSISGPQPTAVRAPMAMRNTTGMNAEQRVAQAARRQAIKQAFNK
jgi:hypothetical protein